MTKEELQAISEMIAPINSRLDQLEEKIAPINGRLDQLEEKIAPINSRLDQLEEKIAPINSRLDQLEEKIAPINGRLDQLEEQIKEARRENNQTRSVIETQICHSIDLLVEGHKEILETLKQYIPTQKQLEQDHVRIYALEETVVEHTAQIEELQRKTG